LRTDTWLGHRATGSISRAKGVGVLLAEMKDHSRLEAVNDPWGAGRNRLSKSCNEVDGS